MKHTVVIYQGSGWNLQNYEERHEISYEEEENYITEKNLARN